MNCELFQDKNNWDYLTDTVTMVTSVLTLVVALRLFERFSFKRQVLQKQLETLYQLINVLQNWTISIGAKGLKEGDDTSFFQYGFRVKFFDMKFKQNDLNYRELFFKEKLLFTYDWYEQNPLIGWDNNPFLPKSIAEKIENFKISFPYPAYETDFSKVTFIDLDSFDKIVKREERPRTNYIHNPKDKICTDFETFHTTCNELITEIEKWLKKYKVENLNLK